MQEHHGLFFGVLIALALFLLAPALLNAGLTGFAPAGTKDVTATSKYTLVSDFAYGKELSWDRTVTVSNPNAVAKTVSLSFGKGAEVVTVPAGAKIQGKNKASFSAPPGKSIWAFRFDTAPIYTKETVLNPNPDNYRKKVEITSDYHYKNIPMKSSLPELPYTHYYTVVLKSTGKGVKKTILDKNKDGKKDEIQWTLPSLSGDEGGIQAEKKASLLSNYDFESLRAENSSLPDTWFLTEDLTLYSDDDKWGYNPLEAGYSSQTAVRAKYLGTSKKIFSDNITSQATGTFNISFMYSPSFAVGANCYWNLGVEILFADGTPDASFPFDIDSTGTLVSTPGEYTTSTTDKGSGWYNITADSKITVDAGKQMRFYVGTDSCPDYSTSSFLIDNVVFQA